MPISRKPRIFNRPTIEAEIAPIGWGVLNDGSHTSFGVTNEYRWFRTLFSYKMDEAERHNLFARVERGKPDGLATLPDMRQRVEDIWRRFSTS